ncbi:polysaccharide biosynthesis/export family protein [Kordiimonas gwangyangensis]|uniref:polysaccharide biosynthesis/export family protein n=1 Tax=Kordiimonas gwangyangensis TaxID=288022 RepID=UPI0012DBD5AF|nr:polysaccharide biosynthesis/export family protein [Kordiimonas gwangyangensis]
MRRFQIVIMMIVASLTGLATSAAAQDTAVPQLDVQRYELGSGDRIRVIVYGEEDLSGEFELDGSGVVGIPLIGPVTIGGRDVAKAERLISEKLADGYLVNPRVSIEVLNYRPFYILGEVKQPGSYPYVNGMTVLNAIALASGFTYRANEKKIVITRKVDGAEKKIDVGDTTLVMPGDIIRVPERFF